MSEKTADDGVIKSIIESVPHISVTENKVAEIYEDFKRKAFNITHNKNYEDLKPYIKEATISAINIMGSEGMTNRNEGSISSSFLDITQKMRQDLISNGLRRVK